MSETHDESMRQKREKRERETPLITMTGHHDCQDDDEDGGDDLVGSRRSGTVLRSPKVQS